MELRFNPFTRKLDWTDITAIPPGTVAELTPDTGGAVSPDAGGNINVLTGVGLTTTGDPGTNTITWTLDGANEGTGSTVGAVTADLITISLGATPTTYIFDVQVVGFNASTPAGVGIDIFGSARTTGAAATVIEEPDKFVNPEAALTGADANLIGSGNNIIVRVTGVGGLTINWRAFLVYRRVA